MRGNATIKAAVFIVAAISALMFDVKNVAHAQPGPSFSISSDFLPFQEFDEPLELDDGTILDNAQVQISRQRAALTYPVVFSQGRTVLVNELSYQLIEFEYKEWVYPLKRLHSASYTLMLQHRLSQKWSVWALGTPSMASDLEAEISRDDFNFQAAAIFIRHFSERFSLGVGAAYSTQFGSAAPIPIIAFDWNNGRNLKAQAILPVSLEFWYRPGPRFDLGLLVSGDGNNYHGDPDIYKVDHPNLRYTMLTIGPAVTANLTPEFHLTVEGGIVGLHRFEFYDADEEAGSFDLKPSHYVRVGLHYGG